MTDEERKQIPLRLPADLARKVDRLTKRSQKTLGSSWSRNDQIVLMLRGYRP